MKDTVITETKILENGEIISNFAFIENRSENIVAIGIDLKSKYARLLSTGDDENIPVVVLYADEETIHLNKDCFKNSQTVIALPEFEGWKVWTAHCSRYTVYICLIKNED